MAATVHGVIPIRKLRLHSAGRPHSLGGLPRQSGLGRVIASRHVLPSGRSSRRRPPRGMRRDRPSHRQDPQLVEDRRDAGLRRSSTRRLLEAIDAGLVSVEDGGVLDPHPFIAERDVPLPTPQSGLQFGFTNSTDGDTLGSGTSSYHRIRSSPWGSSTLVTS